MKTRALLIIIATFLSAATPLIAADRYVRPGGAGAKNGSDWNNAWDSGGIAWANVNPGDTIWLAGGTHTRGITFAKSGSAGHPITLKRVLATDPTPTAAAGWNASFDAQVVITPANDACFEWSTNAGSHITIDGRFPYGIRAGFDNSANAFLACAAFNASVDVAHILIRFCDLHGPAGSTSGDFDYQGDNGVVNVRGGAVDDLTLAHCDLHGAVNIFYNISDLTNFTVEHCDIRDNRSSNPAMHANIFYNYSQGHDFTFRYNKIHNWQVEGFLLWAGAARAAWYFHGNVFYDQATGVATCFWPGSNTANQAQGPLFLYNNTFVGCQITSGQSRSWQFASGSMARNNIYWQSGWANNSLVADSDYNCSSASIPGANSISNGANPFVHLAGKDFRIVATVGAAYPKDQGVALSAPFAQDAHGVARGADGAWDIGAYESGAAAPAVAPAITAQPRDATVIVGQTATFSATATGNPAPTYQWRKNDVDIAGATAASYTTPATTLAGSGATFRVVARNSMGSALSSPATLTVTAVNSAPLVSMASATPSLVTGTAANLSATASDDGGEPSLVYTWTATGPASVAFSPNGGNAAKASTATFSRIGSYILTVTAQDAANLSGTKTVTVSVNATPTVSISPTGASVQPGMTVDFNALLRDQFNVVLATQPTVTWTVSGGGTIDANGLFTAGAATPSPTGGVSATTYVVTATAGSASRTALVTVSTASTALADGGGSGPRCGGGSALALIGGLGLMLVRRRRG